MIEVWFPTLISVTHLDEFKPNNDAYAQCVYDVRKTSSNNVDWRCDTFSTLGLYDMKNHILFKDLLSVCADRVAEFAKEFGVNSSPSCTNAWLNLAPPNEYQEYHIHANSHFSAVYYVKTTQNCGNIVFKSAESSTDMFPLPVTGNTPANYKTCSYTPEESMLVIFRSNLYHMVEKNKSAEDRISIAMNFVV